MPKLPACGREWCQRRVMTSTGGDWWSTCHVESCARYSRLWCGIGVSPLLPPPFTYRGGVLCGLELRTLCLETELEKKKKKKIVVIVRGSCLFPLLRGTEWGLGWGGGKACDMLYKCVSRTAMYVRMWGRVAWSHVWWNFLCVFFFFLVWSRHTACTGSAWSKTKTNGGGVQ